jgi:hypothetical protein
MVRLKKQRAQYRHASMYVCMLKSKKYIRFNTQQKMKKKCLLSNDNKTLFGNPFRPLLDEKSNINNNNNERKKRTTTALIVGKLRPRKFYEKKKKKNAKNRNERWIKKCERGCFGFDDEYKVYIYLYHNKKKRARYGTNDELRTPPEDMVPEEGRGLNKQTRAERANEVNRKKKKKSETNRRVGSLPARIRPFEQARSGQGFWGLEWNRAGFWSVVDGV